jgi:glycosyltransferase involved in cell wall biosynthesis
MDNKKLLCVVSSPISTFSGYGERARGVAKALIKLKGQDWDIKFLPQRWGNCPFGALDVNNPEDRDILDRIMTSNGLPEQPYIFMQLSVSNEFQPYGKVNIGMSALVETTIVPSDMMEGLNRMTFNIVSSNFGKKIAEETSFEKKDNNTKQTIGLLKLEKPVEVLFEGVDTNYFKRIEKSDFDLSSINEEFCYIVVAHWLPGELGEDRKQLTSVIKAFLEAFKDKKKKPALILKTSLAGFSIIEEETILNNIDNIRKTVKGNLPNIYFIHGELSLTELNSLYNHPKVKSLIQVSNEGFGRPALEFSAASSKPIIASPFGGHLDFLNQEYNVFVSGRVEQLHPSATNQFLLPESMWYKVDIAELSKVLIEVYENYNKYVELGKRQGHISRTNFNLDKMTEKLSEILKNNVPEVSTPMTIKLPKLLNIKKSSTEYLEEIK